ncbi:hypothetical protein [Succinivibrio dextrinosolvens]|uniref:hypothetical protein n=1 Tax=Succinivibrio dextrinosolvens TaxID=83771 RepID=UPI001923FD26|nr:hypothetical protein [Succinivibrio dextrinosolvens]
MNKEEKLQILREYGLEFNDPDLLDLLSQAVSQLHDRKEVVILAVILNEFLINGKKSSFSIPMNLIRDAVGDVSEAELLTCLSSLKNMMIRPRSRVIL